MTEQLMGTYVELWPVAADELGIYLVSGVEPWRAGPVTEFEEPDLLAVNLLKQRGEWDASVLRHGTSWRPKFTETPDPLVRRCRQIDTFVAVLGMDNYAAGHGPFEYVPELWSDALPLSWRIYRKLGKPYDHGPMEPPDPADGHAMWHAIRHLEHLRRYDTTQAAQLDRHWQRHLSVLKPALAGMYRREAGAEDEPILDESALAKAG
jgi:hypothetical protein